MRPKKERPIPSVQFTIRLKPDVVKELKAMARAEGVFPAQVVSRLISEAPKPKRAS